MAHVRKGKTAKRNRRLGALERLRACLLTHEWRQQSDLNYGDYEFHRYEQIKSEIATLEARI